MAGTLEITSPLPGTAVDVRQVTVTGTAPADARIVRDIALAADESTIAGSDGAWEMVVELRPGVNELVFRVSDDGSTEVRLTVICSEPTPTPAPPTPTPSPTPSPTTGPTEDPWPSAFRLLVCNGVNEIDDAGNHIAQAGEAAQIYDIEEIIDHNERAADDAQQARYSLDSAPVWAPGRELVSSLDNAALKTLQAANLMKLGAQTAVDAKFAAVAELVGLQEETGFSCFD